MAGSPSLQPLHCQGCAMDRQPQEITSSEPGGKRMTLFNTCKNSAISAEINSFSTAWVVLRESCRLDVQLNLWFISQSINDCIAI